MVAMRRFEGSDGTYFVGETCDIKAMYKSIARNENTNIYPRFVDSPRFSDRNQVYGLCIDDNNEMTVVNSDTILLMILEGELN